MAGAEQKPQRVYVPHGEVEVFFPDGTIFHIVRHPQSVVVEQRSSTVEAQREEWKASYPELLYSHIRSVFDYHGYTLLGGEAESGNMTLMETRVALEDTMKQGKALGLSHEDVMSLTDSLLKNVTIPAHRHGDVNPIVKGVREEVFGIGRDVWQMRRRQRRTR